MRQILKQSSWLFFAQSATRVISFFYVIFLARTLGVEDFGLYSVALAYFGIISSISDFGFNRFLTREVARDHSKAPELLWNIVLLRLTLTSVFFAVFSGLIYFFDPDKLRVSLILLATISILPQAVAFTFDAIFVAMRRLEYSAISLFISSLTTAISGYLLIRGGFGAMGAVNALIFGQGIYAIVLILFLIRMQGLHFGKISLYIIKKAVLGSLPYGLLGVLGLLYFRIDTVLLSYLKGSFETGIYGAAYKFLEATVFIPSALSLALFPVFARIHESSPAQLKRLYFKALKIMIGLGIVVFLGYVLVLPEIIKAILPQYLPAISAIRILSLAIPFMFIHIPGVTVLLSSDKYLKQVLLLSLVTVGFNIIGNLSLIPQAGFIGASWMTVASEVLSFAVFFALLKHKVLK